jgi:hypothetical protein
VYDEIEKNQIFGTKEIKEILDCSPSKPSPFFCPEIKFCIFFLKFQFIIFILSGHHML